MRPEYNHYGTRCFNFRLYLSERREWGVAVTRSFAESCRELVCCLLRRMGNSRRAAKCPYRLRGHLVSHPPLRGNSATIRGTRLYSRIEDVK